MPAVLHLGVVDQPYAHEGNETQGITTGEVADILEARYHVMEVFAEMHWDDIIGALTNSYAGAAENMMLGSPFAGDPTATASEDIKIMFQNFIDLKEMDALGIGYPYPVPTLASLRGVNHRMKHPYAKREPRPSFRDTGLYQSSFWAWVEQK